MCGLHLFVLDRHLATLWESNCQFGFLLVMFPLGSFDVSDGRCGIIVSIPDHCLPFYFDTGRDALSGNSMLQLCSCDSNEARSTLKCYRKPISLGQAGSEHVTMQQDHFHPVQPPVWEISAYLQQTEDICQWQSHLHELDVTHHSTNDSWSNAQPQHTVSAIAPTITKLDLKFALGLPPSNYQQFSYFPTKACVVGTH